MKKIIIVLFSSLLLASCGASKVERDARKTFNGTWTLSQISFPGSSENLRVTLFDDATAECLRNSQWNFVSNNNRGIYSSSNAQCDTTGRFFIWSIDEVDATAGTYNLLIKPTDEDYDSNMSNAGYRINLITLTENQMVWEQVVNFEGEPFTIRMNFNKN